MNAIAPSLQDSPSPSLRDAPSPWANPTEIRAALREPLARPPVIEADALPLDSHLSFKARLLLPATEEELRYSVRVPTPKTVAAVVTSKPVAPPLTPLPRKHAPGSILYVEFCKMKQTYTLEYRKRENGERYLHHAEDHLVEQLKSKGDPNEDKARMKALHYSFVKHYYNG